MHFYSHSSEKITKVMALQQHVQQSMFYKNDGGYNAWATVCKSVPFLSRSCSLGV